jgi:hypothetical protein
MERARDLKIFAMLLPGLTLAILALFTLGETLGGDGGGAGHLVQALPIALLMWLGWKQPAWGGLCMVLLSLLAANYFADALRGPEWLAPFLIFVAPTLLSGLLLLGAAWLERRAI